MIKFEKPVAEIEKFELLDVITTSVGCEVDLTCNDYDCPNDTGWI